VGFKVSETNNKNIVKSRLNENGYNNMLYIEFIPYNREITKEYIKYHLKNLIKINEDFVLYAQGFNFDGLYETNKDLIKNGCIIQNNYTNKYTSFKGVGK
jgi:hypothetical protein